MTFVRGADCPVCGTSLTFERGIGERCRSCSWSAWDAAVAAEARERATRVAMVEERGAA